MVDRRDTHYRSLREAYRAIRGKRYSEAAVILERITATVTHDPYPHLLYAIACLFTNRFDLVDRTMTKIRMIDPLYLPFIHLQGFMALKSASSPENVLGLYHTFLETFPSDRTLLRCMDRIRKAPDFALFQQKALLGDFVPLPAPGKSRRVKAVKGPARIRRRRSRLFVVLVTGAAVMTLAVGMALLSILFPMCGDRKEENPVRSDSPVDRITLGGSGYDLITRGQRSKTPEFYYETDALVRDFNEAKHLIKRERYNQALLILNRIHHSNASMSARERADFLIRFVLDVRDRDFEAVPVKDVSGAPYKYRGVALAWNGVVANLRNRKEGASFTLLTDFSRGRFSAVVDVYSPDPLDGIDNGDHVSVKGLFMDSLGSETRLHVRASEVKRSTRQ